MKDLDLTEAATAACHVSWHAIYGSNFDTACPDRDRWIREELAALRPVVPIIARQVAEEIARRIEAEPTPPLIGDQARVGWITSARRTAYLAREVADD